MKKICFFLLTWLLLGISTPIKAQKDTVIRHSVMNLFFVECRNNGLESNNSRMYFKKNIAKNETLTWKAKNAIFFELFGAGGMPGYTLNYDRLLYGKGKVRTSARIGANPYPFPGYYNFPLMLNLIIGKKIGLELGAGAVFLITKSHGQLYTGGAFTSVLGVRYQDINRGFFFRAGITPTIGGVNGGLFASVAGVSFGYSF